MPRSRPPRRAITLLGFAVAASLLIPVRVEAATASSFSDVPAGHWAKKAIQFVGLDHTWMRDYGMARFRPGKLETRKYLAHALVLAFAPNDTPDPDLKFDDVAASDPFYPSVNIAVKNHWLKATGGYFHPDRAVTTVMVHRAMSLALGLGAVARGINRIHTADDYRFKHPGTLGTTLVGMLIGLRYNHDDESKDVGPFSKLTRAEVAWSLYRAYVANTTESWRKTELAPYENIQLPALSPAKREVVEFGLRYIGYPYIYAGEWYRPTTDGYCCGAQPTGGFDCSGFVWWAMKAPEASYDNTFIRPYKGWWLPQRSSHDMASVGTKIPFDKIHAGDLLFYDGDGDGVIDHVDLYVGNGWALDSSSGVGGVVLLRVKDGWYRDHFKWARRIMK